MPLLPQSPVLFQGATGTTMGCPAHSPRDRSFGRLLEVVSGRHIWRMRMQWWGAQIPHCFTGLGGIWEPEYPQEADTAGPAGHAWEGTCPGQGPMQPSDAGYTLLGGDGELVFRKICVWFHLAGEWSARGSPEGPCPSFSRPPGHQATRHLHRKGTSSPCLGDLPGLRETLANTTAVKPSITHVSHVSGRNWGPAGKSQWIFLSFHHCQAGQSTVPACQGERQRPTTQGAPSAGVSRDVEALIKKKRLNV